VGCKSPLTGGIKEANSGGQAAQVMGRLGYAAIILEGRPPMTAWYKVYINKDGVKVESAADLKGLGNYATVENSPRNMARRRPASPSARPVR
jgi:aldehyde:ferredoxin oxidoreductase